VAESLEILMDWIGVDLDGTLAVEDDWRGIEHIGAPIPRMVERVKALIAEGHDVRIFTARASRLQSEEERAIAIRHVEDWCETHLGQRLSVTNEKDHYLKWYYDDRAIAVECNTGNVLSAWTIKPLPCEQEKR
jgi:hydroxymethylpyrimidine pyrophosphatase-like HAD family hydrolase